MSIIFIILLLVIAWVYLGLQRGKNPKIPRPTSPNGFKSRVVGLILFGALVVAFIYETALGGLTRANIASTISIILFLIIAFFEAKRRQP
jgi:ABC-type sugar transport system permease subunit